MWGMGQSWTDGLVPTEMEAMCGACLGGSKDSCAGKFDLNFMTSIQLGTGVQFPRKIWDESYKCRSF